VTPKAYCNCLAQQRGLDPVGHAGDFEDLVVLEVPLPWKLDMLQQAGPLPQPVIDLMDLWLQQYCAGDGYPHYALVVAPDPAYSRDGFRRAMFYTRPAGTFARFDKTEYVVPRDAVGALVWSWYQDRERLPEFERYRATESGNTRDILVCTHGNVDAACAKFGYPLYKHIRDTYANDHLRVWRVSHFGGHVFASTLLDVPTGHYWAYVEKEQAEQIVRRDGDVSTLRGHYRGWAGFDSGFLQAAECDLWQRHGWVWFDCARSGKVIAQDEGDDPTWADVCIRYRAPGDRAGTSVMLRVEVSRYVETELSTGADATYAYPQYRISQSRYHTVSSKDDNTSASATSKPI